jgi:hypothetical protein
MWGKGMQKYFGWNRLQISKVHGIRTKKKKNSRFEGI